jgi:hypothetical protein
MKAKPQKEFRFSFDGILEVPPHAFPKSFSESLNIY